MEEQAKQARARRRDGSKQRNRLRRGQLERIAEWVCRRIEEQGRLDTRAIEQAARDAAVELGFGVTASNIRAALALEGARRQAEPAVEDLKGLAAEVARLHRILDIQPIDQDRLDRLASTS